MSENMIERVARAICGENQGDADAVIGSVMGDREAWTDFIPEARAAIEAMREPTREMVDAGADGSGEDSSWVARGAWAAMIDTALAPARPND